MGSISYKQTLSLFLLIPVIILGLAIAGCGGDEAVDTTDQATGASNIREPLPLLDTPENPVTVAEQETPYGTGRTTPQTAGMTFDGLQLLDIRWADHGSFFRVVFDMGTADGEMMLETPHAECSPEEGGRQVRVLLGGVRSISDNPNAQATDLAIDDDLVVSVKRMSSQDDQAMLYAIDLSRPATYSLSSLGAPGRIVVDIRKG